ncbi:hypothetical protein L3Q82_001783 [Scortum barcoo]|uniref:Uncharacterized protein n=1 Tax=Scortum barcoo TaxID=214431 RepID=A0ACB8W4L0_9TELE|nr:hypothetical protein L3Q82_001783 [Scortum barcoo]
MLACGTPDAQLTGTGRLAKQAAARTVLEAGKTRVWEEFVQCRGAVDLDWDIDIVGRWKKYFEDLLNPTDLPSNEEAEAGVSEVDSSITQAEVTEARTFSMYWERFAAECEAAGMRISTSKSEAMVLDRKRVACPLQVGGEVLPQVEEFKYLGVLFTSEGKIEREIDRRIGAASAVGYAVGVLDRRGEEGAESKGEALDLPVNLRSHPHLWS